MADHINLVVLRGSLSSPPRARELPSGATLTLLEVSTRVADGAASVPVVLPASATAVPVSLDAGDEVVVVGRVVRRYFRAGGVTQSRTEVVADRLVPASRRVAAGKAVRDAAAALAADP